MDRIGPGTLLAGRYRLAERVHADGDVTSWRAEDATLERPVAVTVLAADHARVQSTLDAARRAALVDDARLQRVLGVGLEGSSGYVVLEWVTGQDVAALAGRVSEQEAVRVVTEAAEALHTAATRSLHHGRLAPHHVVRSSDGAVRVLGTAIDVAATGQATPAAAARPEARDVRDLGAVLYALLGGHWPFGSVEGLEAAPTEKGRPVPVGRLRADVSAPLGRLLEDTLAGTGADTLTALVGQLDATRAALDASTTASAGTAPVDGPPEVGDGDRTRAGDDTDVITPVPTAAGVGLPGAAGAAAAGAAAAGAAAAAAAGAAGPASAATTAPAATATPVATTGTAAVAAAAAGEVPPARPADRPAAPSAPVGEVRPPGYPTPTRPAPLVVSPQDDDGWDLLPVDDEWDEQYDGRYDEAWAAGGTAEEPQPWDEQPWEQGDTVWPGPASGRGTAAAVVPAARGAGRRRPAGAGTGVVVVLLMGAFVVAGLVWALERFRGADEVAAPVPQVSESVVPSVAPSAPAPAPAPEPEPTAADLVEVISPGGVQALDPQGDGEENDQEAPRAIDGDPGTSWTTQRYNSQDFGGLKDGLGLVFDLGEPRAVSQVLLDAPGDDGTYEIRAANGPGFDGSTVVATGSTGDGTAELGLEEPVTTQFVLVWFTSLPEVDGDWRGVVDEVQVQVQ